jgi:hypothetical protein
MAKQMQQSINFYSLCIIIIRFLFYSAFGEHAATQQLIKLVAYARLSLLIRLFDLLHGDRSAFDRTAQNRNA